MKTFLNHFFNFVGIVTTAGFFGYAVSWLTLTAHEAVWNIRKRKDAAKAVRLVEQSEAKCIGVNAGGRR